jgi:hypothetical protein
MSIFTIPNRYDAASEWSRLIKRIVARFARGNISAQNARLQTADERAAEHVRAKSVAARMRARFQKAV